MQCYTELTPPTAVTHALTLPLTSATTANLVVARSSLLQIFNIKLTSTPGAQEAGHDNEDDGTNTLQDVARPRKSTKLVLVAEYNLSGSITCLDRVKVLNSKCGGEALLIGFRDARLSLVEWDAENHNLSTISIHYYEQEDLLESPWAPDAIHFVNTLSADPESRCAAFRFGLRNIAIIPFRQADEDEQMQEDWDEDVDGPKPTREDHGNGTSAHVGETPYLPSFVLKSSALHSDIIHPVHLAFLHEYREPTFAILSSTHSTSHALLYERKDHLVYMVFTLDLQQKASTTILSVPGLPSDLTTIIPMPSPLGGAILLGSNELIHVDQSGKTSGIAVNMFAKQCTAFTLVDRSDLGYRLEGCRIHPISGNTGEVLLILRTGDLAILKFDLDGKTISGMTIRSCANSAGLTHVASNTSCHAQLGPSAIFVGNETANAVVLGWSDKNSTARRQKMASDDLQERGSDDDLDEDDDADDDLYGEDSNKSMENTRLSKTQNEPAEYVFRQHDCLINIAPANAVTMGRPKDPKSETGEADVAVDLELVLATGCGVGGALSIMTKHLEPDVKDVVDLSEAQGLWTVNAKAPSNGKPIKGDVSTTDDQSDRYMIVAKTNSDGAETSDVYAIASGGFELLKGTEFEPDAGLTIEAGVLGKGMRIIQALKSEVRSYDGGKHVIPYVYLICVCRCLLRALEDSFHRIQPEQHLGLLPPCQIIPMNVSKSHLAAITNAFHHLHVRHQQVRDQMAN